MAQTLLGALTAMKDGQDLAAEAETFGQATSLKVDIKDMKLPPPHLVDELDNSDAATRAETQPADEEVTLDFFGDDLPFREFTLRYPFRWAGEHVRAVEVHQLTTADIGRASAAGQAGDNYDIYAFMVRVKGTGTLLPARVLRKLPVLDGIPITDACWDFLPRSSPPAAD